MKIVFLESTLNLGGARFSTIELAAKLQTLHEVYYIDMHGSCKPFLDLCTENNINLTIVDKCNNPIIIASDSKFKKTINIIRFVFYYFQLRKKLYNVLDDIKPNYIIVNNSKMLSFLFLHSLNMKVVMFFRGWGLRKQFDKKSYLLFKMVINIFACVSESTKQAIYNNGLAKLENIFVVHTAIEESKLPKEVAEIKGGNKTFKIIHSGSFLSDKGLHISVEIARKLKELSFDFHLVIAGIVYQGSESQQYLERIQSLIKSYQLENFITLVVNKSNVISYFRACDVLIHPSSTEGLPRVILEAMTLKKPVIANAVGGVTDLIINNYTGIITNYNCIDDYVTGILKLANDKDYYQKIKDNAYNLIQSEYTKETQLESLNKCLNYGNK